MSRNQGPKVSGGQTKLSGSLAPSNKLPFPYMCVWMCLRVCYVCVKVCNMCVSVPCVSVCVLTCCAQSGASVNLHTQAQLSNLNISHSLKSDKGVCVLYMRCAHSLYCMCVYWLKSCQSKAMFFFVLNKFKNKFKCIGSDDGNCELRASSATAVQRLARESYTQLSSTERILSSTSHQCAPLSPF